MAARAKNRKIFKRQILLLNKIGPGVLEDLTFKDFSIFSSGGHLVYRSRMILAILVGSHLGNIPMKFESHWPKGSGGVSFLSKLFTIFYF